MSARRAGASHRLVSVRMLRVVTVRASCTARLMGPPPIGIEPAAAYFWLSRPAARITRYSRDVASPSTTTADSAAMTSSALPTIVSSTSLRSSDDVSEWPMASIARKSSARCCRSLMSVRIVTMPAIAPLPSRHGAQRASSRTTRSSSRIVCDSSIAPGVSPASARRTSGASAWSRNSGSAASALRPTASARETPVNRCMATFHSRIRSAGSRTTRASARLSRRPSNGILRV